MVEFNARDEKKATVVSVKGKVDTITAPEFGQYLSDQIDKNQNTLVVNMTELYYMTSAGLREILGAAKKLREKHEDILLTGLQEHIMEVFKISGFSSIFKIFDTEESALKQI